MKKISEYSLVISLTLVVLTILFHQFLIGELVFMSGDSLAPQAVKKSIQNIKNQTGSFPYWFPYIFSGMPTIHSLLNTNDIEFAVRVVIIILDWDNPPIKAPCAVPNITSPKAILVFPTVNSAEVAPSATAACNCP